LASYKILVSLWTLGTTGTKLVDREWIISELNRHRPLIGECLGSFASAFPIAFFEPEYNVNNKNSIMYGGSNISEQSLEGQDVMTKVAKNLPSMQEVIDEIGQFCDSNGKYESAPHIIEVLLPTICSYLTYWWQFSPAARVQQAANDAKAKQVLEKNMSVDGDGSSKSGKKQPSVHRTQLAIAAPPTPAAPAQTPNTPSDRYSFFFPKNIDLEEVYIHRKTSLYFVM
jgi:hypothetical protein